MMFTYTPYRVNRPKNSYSSAFDELENAGVELMRATRVGAFRTDIEQLEDRFIIESELPGFKKEDISIDLKDDVMTISANRAERTEPERTYVRRERLNGTFTRSFDISGIDQDRITAAYADGVLTLTLPLKKEEKPEDRRITIE